MKLRDAVTSQSGFPFSGTPTCAQSTVPIYKASDATYLDSGASISVTGSLHNLTNLRPSRLQIHSFATHDPVKATAMGDWGPIHDVHHVPNGENLISTGSMLDGTTAGIYSTRKHSFLVSGIQIGSEVAPGQFSVSAHPKAVATKIATRQRPGKLYEADIPAIASGLASHAAFEEASTGRTAAVSYISNLSPAVNAKLQAELDAVKPKPASLWYSHDDDDAQTELLSSLFPQVTHNPWTNLPVLPRTKGRALIEAVMFAPIYDLRQHSKTRVPRPLDRSRQLAESVPDPPARYSHESLKQRLLQRHRALGHPSKRVFKRMLELSEWKSDVDLAKHVRRFMPHCIECMTGKPKKKPRNKASDISSKATRYMQRLTVDCSGIQPMDSISGKKAYMLIVDQYTRFTWVYFIKSTSDCPKILDNFLRKAKRLNDAGGVQHIQFIRSDGGPDFSSASAISVLDAHDVTHELTNAGSSNQNGIVERRIGIVAERTRTALAWSDLPAAWWAEAVRYSVQTLNLTPSAALPGCVSPYYMRTGRHHPTRLLQPFGCLASVYRQPQDRPAGKLAQKAADVGIFLGYDERSDGGVQGYRVYNWETNKTTNRYDVDFNPDLPGMKYIADLAANSVQMQFLNREVRKYFDESNRFHKGYVKKVHKGLHGRKLFEILYDDGDREDMDFNELIQHLVTSTSEVSRRIAQQYPRLARVDPRSDAQQFTEGRQQYDHVSKSPEGSARRTSARKRKRTSFTNVSGMGDIDNTAFESTATLGKPRRNAVLHTRFSSNHKASLPPLIELDFKTTLARSVPVPKTFKHAMRGPYRKYWIEAAQLELRNMQLKGVYELVKLGEGERIRPIRGKWVLTIKKNEDGTIDKFRARYVALGNTQRAGIDYRKTTAPVLNAVSLRCILAVATEKNWPLKQLDVSVAYLNSFLESDIRLFLAPPPGLYVPPGYGCLARKGLYGLCQSGHRWAVLKADTLRALGFKRSAAEPCIWIRNDHCGLVITGVVVDDFIITGDTEESCDIFAAELMKAWDCTYLGDLEWCINLRVRRDRTAGTMTIDQSEYIQEIVEKFNMQHSAPISTPADPSVHLSQDMGPANEDERQKMSHIPYSSAVGSVLYTRLTRIDCLASIAEVARFMNNPGKKHWHAVKRILRYLKATKYWGLCYKSSCKDKTVWRLILYVDSGYAMDPDRRRSRYGYIVYLNANPVAFGTGLTQKTATSTPEAEYIALAHGLKETLWVYQTLLTMGLQIELPIKVYEDNQACIQIADNPISQRRTRHIDIRYHFVRDYIEDGTITMEYCTSAQMLADIMTKIMHKPTFERLRNKIIGDVMQFLQSDLLTSIAYCQSTYNNLVQH